MHRVTASLAFGSSVVVFVGRDVRARGGPASRPTAAGPAGRSAAAGRRRPPGRRRPGRRRPAAAQRPPDFFSRAARIEGAPPLFGGVLVPCPIYQMVIAAV